MIAPDAVVTAKPLKMLVPTAVIESRGKSTLFPIASKPYTRLFVTVICTFDHIL